MDWKIRHGGDVSAVVNFRGRGGQIRPLRKDELLISKVTDEHEQGGIGIRQCMTVIGRKAWRVNEEGKLHIEDLLVRLNENEITELEFLEALERKFEGWM